MPTQTFRAPAWVEEYVAANPQRQVAHTPVRVTAPKVAELRGQGQTLSAIGREMGLSRERIRKICVQYAIPGVPKAPRPIPGFSRRMKRWLWESGYRRCQICHHWSDQVTKTTTYCRTCNTERCRVWRARKRGVA